MSDMPVAGPIENSPDLLDEMMADLAADDGPLSPGPYWAGNQRATLDWLKRNDLNQFRVYERRAGGLSNFGGSSRWRSYAEILAEKRRLKRSILYRAGQELGIGPVKDWYRVRIRDLTRETSAQQTTIRLIEQLLHERDSDGELERLEMTPVGMPSDLITIDGRSYTPKFLSEFFVYLDMKQHIDVASVDTFIEVGPGVGVFAELMAKLKPGRRIYLIDVPPQLYVTQQVLSAVFPGEIADYQTIKRDPGVLAARNYRIYLLAPWQLDQLDLASVDLAFNQTSFPEMRKETVRAYLSFFDRWGVRDVCIRGSEGGGKNFGGPVFDDYAAFLPSYDLVARVPFLHEGSARPAGVEARDIGRPVSAFYFKRREPIPAATVAAGRHAAP